MLKQHILIILIVSLLSSCHSSKRTTKSQPVSSDRLTNIRWELSQHNEEEAASSTNQDRVHLILNSSDNSITGFSGCNLFYGIYAMEGENRINFSSISTSNQNCANNEFNEELFLQKLEATTHYSIKGETLILKNETETLHQFTKSINYPNNIEEKYWKLKIVNGKEVSMSEYQEREIFFRLKSDENIAVGFSGCNHFQGSYTLDALNKIHFNPMSSTKRACPNLDINEAEIFQIFELADNYLINSDILLLKTKDGQNLAKFEAIYFN
ncbi:MAG TPA: META domain-containing protein [Marinilabiliaceae bacterium]|nr:META domain-containing protein [Marinilabiliaceae bacterium]